MICYKCSMKKLLKDKEKAMKKYTEKLKKEKYDTPKQTKSK